jgi:hypothetical protein
MSLEHTTWSRRQFLGAGALGAASIALPPPLWLPGQPEAAVNGFSAMSPLRLAMHVHGSWSEGAGSWEAQFTQASSTGVDVLYMTDHDARATASGYLTSLSGVTWVRSTTGSLAQQASTASGSAIRLLAESSSATNPASVSMAVQPKPQAFNRLRTSIAGHTLVQTITTATLSGGALYEVVVDLSYHPATQGRPAGRYRLVYRFGTSGSSRFTENGGLTGVVTAPRPAAGSVQTLAPEDDVAAIWPSMLAFDNCMYGLSFVARSPGRGAVADVRVQGLQIQRSQSSPSAVAAHQQQIISTYQPRFPALAVRATTEISKTLPDVTSFGIPQQYFPDYSQLSADHDTRYHQISAQVHSQGGLLSYNHPFGYNTGPLLSASERTTKRRQVFTSMRAVNQFEADIVEVGYTLRGNVDTQTHLGLWDTFSRNGTFLTGTGVSDDHQGQHWKTLSNGFLTGTWSTGRTDGELDAALLGGRAYSYHAGRWANGQTDLLVDDSVPMGHVSVSSRTSRSLAILATNLPSGSSVQLVSGPVDYSGAVDPSTTVVRTLSPSAFSGNVATVSVDTSTSRFYRVTVLSSSGAVIGAGNPVWLLRSPPPSGVPAARS